MKKHFVFITTAILTITTAIPIIASEAISSKDAQLRPDFTIIVDGSEINFKTANGDAAYPILYKDSTYLPLRAIGEIMGKNVNWDEDNKTITISGKRDTTSSNKDNPDISKKNITIQERQDFTIIIDDIEKTFYSANGTRIYPILYNGSTYLPLRSIGEIMNKEVLWNATDKIVTLNGDFTVTDADSFETVDKEEISSGYIGRKEVQRLALKHALETENTVKFVRTELNKVNGEWVYDIEFYSNEREYDYVIDAETGKVLDHDYNIDNWTKPEINDDIGLEKAKEIALNHAGLKSNNVKFVKTKINYEDGKKIYEIEFYKGNNEYDYEIDATTGKIIDFDYDAENYTSNSDKTLSIDEAKKVILKYIGLNDNDNYFVKYEMDYDDGQLVYEFEIRLGRIEYECKINAKTGAILEIESDYND